MVQDGDDEGRIGDEGDDPDEATARGEWMDILE